jgi:hypothetical protein
VNESVNRQDARDITRILVLLRSFQYAAAREASDIVVGRASRWMAKGHYQSREQCAGRNMPGTLSGSVVWNEGRSLGWSRAC